MRIRCISIDVNSVGYSVFGDRHRAKMSDDRAKMSDARFAGLGQFVQRCLSDVWLRVQTPGFKKEEREEQVGKMDLDS